jgi:aspartyl-tRNA synthetase
VILSGWIDDIRDMGGMVFLTLRDRYGVTQVHFDPQVHTVEAKPEYCVKVVGTVVPRPSGQENTHMSTGDIEVELTSYEVLTACKELPFPIRDAHGSSEEIRFKHRFLDIRRQPVLKNIEFRARMNHFTRNWFTHADFLEVQTPLFTVSSPE